MVYESLKDMKKCLFVDTGKNTGWAFFTGDEFPIIGSFSLPSKSTKQRESYIVYMGEMFNNLLDVIQPHYVYLEEPEFWEGSNKSRMAAQRGDLLGLQACCITYADRCAVKHINFKLVSPRGWKGTLSKEATEHRVAMINGIYYSNEHVADAVAFGFSMCKDVWNIKKRRVNFKREPKTKLSVINNLLPRRIVVVKKLKEI